VLRQREVITFHYDHSTGRSQLTYHSTHVLPSWCRGWCAELVNTKFGFDYINRRQCQCRFWLYDSAFASSNSWLGTYIWNTDDWLYMIYCNEGDDSPAFISMSVISGWFPITAPCSGVSMVSVTLVTSAPLSSNNRTISATKENRRVIRTPRIHGTHGTDRSDGSGQLSIKTIKVQEMDAQLRQVVF